MTFSAPTALTTSASFPSPGVYALRLTASDGVLSTSSIVQVTVLVNFPPVITIGPDQTIVSAGPVIATLSATVTDDGLPIGSQIALTWNSLQALQTPHEPSTTVQLPGSGSYLFSLTASDGPASSVQPTAITVLASPPPPPPVVSIASPLEEDDLHKPTPVIGSVSGGSWTLAYSLNNDEGAAATPFTTIASGNGPVSNATLGNFDPSVLLNGIYTIKLTSNDVTGFVPPHLLTTITDARGVTVLQNVYNAGGQMTQTRDPQNGSYFYAYPAANQERITDNFPSGLPKTVTDALGNVTRFDYDNNGNVVQQTDALGNLRAFTYDGSNRRLSG